MWIQSYFENRTQIVKYNKSKSNIREIKTGVPQGSILGPILFLLYINDIVYSTEVGKFYIFADDTNVLISESSDLKLTEKLNTIANDISNWLMANKIKVNVGKSSIICFNSTITGKVCLDGCEIKHTESVKYLGFLVDNQLNFKNQFGQTISRLSRAIGIIRKLKNLIDIKTKLQLYYSLFQSHLLYCTSVYGLRYKKYFEEFNRLQLKILSDIFGLSYSKTEIKMKELKILKACDLIKFQIGIIMFKALQGVLPAHVQARFVRNKDVHNRSSISSFNFKVSYCNSSTESNCLSVTGVSFWNSLPLKLKTITTFQVFKCKLKDYLLTGH